MLIELCVVQFWYEIILVISNQTRAVPSFDFEIMRMISDQIALHSVPLPLLIWQGRQVLYARQMLTMLAETESFTCHIMFSCPQLVPRQVERTFDPKATVVAGVSLDLSFRFMAASLCRH